MNNIKGLPPFKRFCVTIGNLPSSYVDSMSYYECLMWLCKYLSDTVVPAINENAESVNELINWFNNLDVQDEIDHKLDEMVESGQLQEIISEYLNSKAIFGFDTVDDMIESENLIDGSYARTCGKDTFNDTFGELYKIREITNEDVVDGDNIIAMETSNTLVAEKIKNNLPKKYLLVGDSYAVGYQGSGVPTIEGYYTKVKNDLGLNAQIIAENGYGLIGLNGNLKWLNLIQNTTIENKETFTDIIICGGMNDKEYISSIPTAMAELVTYLRTNFPNAEIHFGMVAKFKKNGTDGEIPKVRRINQAYRKNAIINKCKFIENSNLALHNISWFIDDNVHPNANGENQLAYVIKQYIVNNQVGDFMSISSDSDFQQDTYTAGSDVDVTHLTIYSGIDKNNTTIYITGYIEFPNNLAVYADTDFVFATLNNSYLCASDYYQGLYVQTNVKLNVNGTLNGADYCRMAVRIYNDKQNNLHMKFINDLDNGNHYVQLSVNKITFYGVLEALVDSNYC